MTLPTTINDIEDLYRILEAYPQWREALRRQLLTPELLAMPDTLAQLSLKMDQLIAIVSELSQRVDENSRQISDLRVIAENHAARMGRMESDMGDLKARFTEARPERTVRDIAEDLKLQEVTIVDDQPLRQFADRLQLEPDVRRSFVRADLVFQARNAAGEPVWCSVEISWTAAPRDLERARRNAGLLQQATGQTAYAVVCGHRWDLYMDWAGVHWLDITKD